ncbi:(2Fe-2S)-binding protein [Billgrantia azerbaijanica]|nr:(2Fe-2S)-binding protein [Halomonas azerbaijanica]
MYVCICKGVTDHQIRDAVEEGARSFREVQRETGCSTQCGKCACVAKQITREAIVGQMAAAVDDLAYAV